MVSRLGARTHPMPRPLRAGQSDRSDANRRSGIPRTHYADDGPGKLGRPTERPLWGLDVGQVMCKTVSQRLVKDLRRHPPGVLVDSSPTYPTIFPQGDGNAWAFSMGYKRKKKKKKRRLNKFPHLKLLNFRIYI